MRRSTNSEAGAHAGAMALSTAGTAVASIAGSLVGVAIFVALVMLGARIVYVRRRVHAMRVSCPAAASTHNAHSGSRDFH